MKRTIIIAEAGVNHNGDIELAKKLIDAAEDAGVDYVKFQTFKAENIVSIHAPKAAYQKENFVEKSDTQFGMLKKLELSDEMHFVLIDYCKNLKVKFLSTPFDIGSISFLKELGVSIGKIPSGEITNLPYLRAMSRAFPQIILSTGMSYLAEIKAAIEVLLESGTLKENIIVLHCNTEYPTPMKDVNLRAMSVIGRELSVRVGYSDHTLGIEVPIAAVALGAELIEKHFTLDKTMAGPDHRASLEPGELKSMTLAIRNIEEALGEAIKLPSESEVKNINAVRKSIVARKEIKAGELFTEDNLVVKRPGSGLSPMEWDRVIGRAATRDFSEDELISINE